MIRGRRSGSVGPCPDFRVHRRIGPILDAPIQGWPSMSEGRVERRLAAILAVDVAGCSRLMGEDEEGTLAALRATGRTGRPEDRQASGADRQNHGDGLSSSLRHRRGALRGRNSARDDRSQRSGVGGATHRVSHRRNLGGIIVEDRDMFGDGVNIAAVWKRWPGRAGFV